MNHTKIEWTERTWNPVTGCTKVSPGCDNCYAETIANRFAGSKAFPNGFDVTLHEDRLTQPLRWRKPATVFVNSMSDLFHADIPDDFIVDVFAVMQATPQHTYQVLTKRPGRMRSLLNSPTFVRRVVWGALAITGEADVAETIPGRNIWLGVSVEDQKWADVRIPALLGTPAAVRFLSCEPLLGPVDLSAWVAPITPMNPAHAPKAWQDWAWPAWVPAAVREQVEGFWSEDWGRGPRAWMRSSHEQGAPAFGATVTLGNGFGPNPPQVTGRFVHAWNNIGRLVLPDGSFAYTSFGRSARADARNIDWVIAGGESGPKARPMHPDWARSLRDQCQAAGVDFFFKQWGAWSPDPADVRRGDICLSEDGDRYDVRPGYICAHNESDGTWMRRVGKGAAGRLLDGRIHNDMPSVVVDVDTGGRS